MIWLVVFCIAMFYFAMHTLGSVQRFFQYPHITAIDEKEADGTMDFPAVTLCNINTNKLSQITEEDIVHIGPLFGIIQNDGVSKIFKI